MGKYINAIKVLLAEVDVLNDLSIKETGEPCPFGLSESAQKLKDLIQDKGEEND